MRTLKVIQRARREQYAQSLSFQTNLLEAKVTDRTLDDALVVVEHEHVYTVGRSTPFQEQLPEFAANVPWVEVARGGQATYHGPGQLVVYPIFDLDHHGRDVHKYLRQLEAVMVDALGRLDVNARQREGLTGLWITDEAGTERKIASIGVGVRKWVSYHGIALNINPDLRFFQAISPCGQDGEVMTSLEEHFRARQKSTPTWEEAVKAVLSSFHEVFGFARADAESSKPSRPKWIRAKAPGSPVFQETNDLVRELKLVTVCEEARCPNIGECWSHKTATFMVMGDLCTRRCSFCAVKDGSLDNLQPLDPLEPYRVGLAVKQLGLKHVVITSVNRDDIPDMGADHFHRVVEQITKQSPDCRVELLIPDMRGRAELVRTILQSGKVHVLNHNVETVPRLYREVRPGSNFKRSLEVLRLAKELHPRTKTKSGIMVGLGETKEEVLEVMDHLRESGVEILTIGQYLQPSDKQLGIQRYVTPEEFADYKAEGLKRGFSYVESGPLVRSSYHAWQHTGDTTEESPYVQPTVDAA